MPELPIFKQRPLHLFSPKPPLRIVSVDGGWKSLDVCDPASAGSWVFCFFSLSAFGPSSPLHRSLACFPLFLFTLSPPSLSWRLRQPRSDAHKGRRLSHRGGLHRSLHSAARALAASLQLLEVTEIHCASLSFHTYIHTHTHTNRRSTSVATPTLSLWKFP